MNEKESEEVKSLIDQEKNVGRIRQRIENLLLEESFSSCRRPHLQITAKLSCMLGSPKTRFCRATSAILLSVEKILVRICDKVRDVLSSTKNPSEENALLVECIQYFCYATGLVVSCAYELSGSQVSFLRISQSRAMLGKSNKFLQVTMRCCDIYCQSESGAHSAAPRLVEVQCVKVLVPQIIEWLTEIRLSLSTDIDGEQRQTAPEILFRHDEWKKIGVRASDEQKNQDVVKNFMAEHPEMDFSKKQFS